MNIYVGNLSYGITEEDLRALFAEFGDVSSAKLIIDRETNRSKGFGFVEMSSNDAANKAIDELTEHESTFHQGLGVVVDFFRNIVQQRRLHVAQRLSGLAALRG